MTTPLASLATNRPTASAASMHAQSCRPLYASVPANHVSSPCFSYLEKKKKYPRRTWPTPYLAVTCSSHRPEPAIYPALLLPDIDPSKLAGHTRIFVNACHPSQDVEWSTAHLPPYLSLRTVHPLFCMTLGPLASTRHRVHAVTGTSPPSVRFSDAG